MNANGVGMQQDRRPALITKAIRLGEQIRELEQRLEPLLLEQADRQEEINRLCRELDLLWLEVGRLKHTSGE